MNDTLALFVAHRQKLVDYATHVMGTASQSEDIVQEAWMRFSSVADPEKLKEPLRYLFRIVRNIALDGRRAQVSQRRYFVPDGGAEIGIAAADESALPDMDMIYRQQLDLVREALVDLPDRTRKAVELHRLEGLKTREVAERLGISVTRAHDLIAKGVEHCRRRLKSAS